MKLISILLPILLSALANAQDDPEFTVGVFITEVLMKIPNWVARNNYDPTPVKPNDTVQVGWISETDTVSATFSNFSFVGLSLEESMGPTFPGVYFDEAFIGLHNRMFGVVPTGIYKINGTIHSNVSVQGEGTWRMQLSGFGHFAHYFWYDNITVTDDGYIDLREASTRSALFADMAFPPFGDVDIQMTGLDAGGYEDEVKERLYTNFVKNTEEIACTLANPVLEYVDTYLTDALLSVPIDEMGKYNKRAKLGYNPELPLRRTKGAELIKRRDETCLDV